MRGIDVYEDNANLNRQNSLVMNNLDLVARIAAYFKSRLPSHIELDDLIQSGYLGLIEASNHYKPEKGASFQTFASIRIKGSIIDELRKNSWGTRESLKMMKQLDAAQGKLEQVFQRQPTSDELASEMNLTLDAYNKLCDRINVCQVISIDHTIGVETIADDVKDPFGVMENEDLKKNLKLILEKLPEKEQILLSLYYVEGLTFKQISEVLDLTEARISQIHAGVIAKIKSRLLR